MTVGIGKICPSCGAKVAIGQTICNKCGRLLPISRGGSSHTPRSKGKASGLVNALGVVFTIAAIVLLWIPWPYQYISKKSILAFIKPLSETRYLNMRPDMLSGIFGIAFVGISIWRGILPPRFDATNRRGMGFILSLVLDITLVATLLQIFIDPYGGDSVLASLWNKKNIWILVACLVLVTVGIRDIARLGFLLMLLSSLLNLITVNMAMGIFGYLAILCATLGFAPRIMRGGMSIERFRSDFFIESA